jgi:Na+/proline symporter
VDWLGIGFDLQFSVDHYWDMADREEEEGRMNGKFLDIPQPTAGMMVGSMIGTACLLIIAVSLGLLAKRRWKSYDEFLIGKRDFGPWVTGFALCGAYLSGWAFCGSTGMVYKVGFSGMWFGGIWGLVGIIPAIWLAATKTRDFAEKLQATTVTETIGRRFESKMLQTMVAASMLFFLFMYSVGQLKAAGGVWYAVTGLPPFWCLLICITIAWIFLAIGGYTGTQWFIAVKGAFIGFVGALLSVWALIYAGGLGKISDALMAQKPSLMLLIDRSMPTVGVTQLFSSYVGIFATPVIFLTMAIGFPHNVSRFLGMKKLSNKDFVTLIAIVFVVVGIPNMLDCSSNGLIARMLFGTNLLANKQWGADLAAPMLAWGIGGTWLLCIYLTALVGAALGTLSALVFIMSANVSRDIIKLWRPKTSDTTLISLNYFLIALFLFLPFYWTLERPPELLVSFMGLAAMGLGSIFVFVTVISYYWRRATKVGAMLTVIYGTVAALYGGWAVFGTTPPRIGMGTMEWILIIGCAITYFGGSFISKAPSVELLNKLFPAKKAKLVVKPGLVGE